MQVQSWLSSMIFKVFLIQIQATRVAINLNHIKLKRSFATPCQCLQIKHLMREYLHLSETKTLHSRLLILLAMLLLKAMKMKQTIVATHNSPYQSKSTTPLTEADPQNLSLFSPRTPHPPRKAALHLRSIKQLKMTPIFSNFIRIKQSKLIKKTPEAVPNWQRSNQ